MSQFDIAQWKCRLDPRDAEGVVFPACATLFGVILLIQPRKYRPRHYLVVKAELLELVTMKSRSSGSRTAMAISRSSYAQEFLAERIK